VQSQYVPLLAQRAGIIVACHDLSHLLVLKRPSVSPLPWLNFTPMLTVPSSTTNPFQLLIATILSAQCTDKTVNKVTPGLFKQYPDPAAMVQADLADLEAIIKPTGFLSQ